MTRIHTAVSSRCKDKDPQADYGTCLLYTCENCIKTIQKICAILIIHGKGLGVVRKSVHNVLSKRKEVTKYHTDNLNDGCTIVYLSVDN